MASSSRSPSVEYDPSVQSIEDLISGLTSSELETTEDEDDDDIEFQDSVIERLLANEDVEGDDDDEYEDASEDLEGDGLELEFEVGDSEEIVTDDNDNNEDEGEDTETEAPAVAPAAAPAAQATTGNTRSIYLTRDQLLRILGRADLRRFLGNSGLSLGDDDDEDEDDQDSGWGRRTRSRGAAAPTAPPVQLEKVPSDKGRELMEAGTFGTNDRSDHRMAQKKRLAYKLMRRELGLGPHGRQEAMSGLCKQNMLPATKPDRIIHYDARCYSGQFSKDGNFFFSCGQDFKVRMYDTANPYDWKYYKQVHNPYGQWTITDASLSSDNKWLAYSSISHIVCLASTDPQDHSTPRVLDFSRISVGAGPASRTTRRYHDHFGIWSIRFSGDGRELVAGTGDYSVYVFDIERNQSILRIPGHEDDVNAVCFGDAASPHILYSGSDDTTLKVWDRRSIGDGRAAGVFLGHTEGLTYVDSKGDGRYIISNGKDQTAKLWDLRKVIPTEKADQLPTQRYTTNFEYRMHPYKLANWRPHPHDCSLVTFRGHQVLKTLIRCHFSPQGSTDGSYVYSGSYDGKVYIWNMDATLAGTIDVNAATSYLRNEGGRTERYSYYGQTGYHTCVRDASWHPDVPMIAATSWNGMGTQTGTCSVHSWNDGLDEDEGEPIMGQRVDAKLVPQRSRATEYGGEYRRARAFTDTPEDDEDDDDDDDDDYTDDI